MKGLDDITGKAVFLRLYLLITLAIFCGCGAHVPSTGSTGSGDPYGNTPDVTPPTVPLGLKATPLPAICGAAVLSN